MQKKVDVYECDQIGTIIDPASDTKDVLIPMPPMCIRTKINPRPVLIYLGERSVCCGENCMESLIEYCRRENVMMIWPYQSDRTASMRVYDYIQKNSKKLNVCKDAVRIAFQIEPDEEMRSAASL